MSRNVQPNFVGLLPGRNFQTTSKGNPSGGRGRLSQGSRGFAGKCCPVPQAAPELVYCPVLPNLFRNRV